MRTPQNRPADAVITVLRERIDHLETRFRELLKQPHSEQQIDDICLVKMELDQARMGLAEYEAKHEVGTGSRADMKSWS